MQSLNHFFFFVVAPFIDCETSGICIFNLFLGFFYRSFLPND